MFFSLNRWTDRTLWTGRIVFQKVPYTGTLKSVSFLENGGFWKWIFSGRFWKRQKTRPIRPSVHIRPTALLIHFFI